MLRASIQQEEMRPKILTDTVDNPRKNVASDMLTPCGLAALTCMPEKQAQSL